MRPRRLAALYSLAALGASMQLPAPATAGTYDVVVCKSGGSAGAAFETLNVALSSVTCPPAPGTAFSGLVAQDQLGTGYHPAGTRGGFSVTAPAGTTITQIVVRRYFGKYDIDWQVAARTAQGQILETCDFNPALTSSCSHGSGVDPDQNTVTYAQLSTPNVEFGFTCTGVSPDACARNPSLHRVWMVVYDATVKIEDPAAPALGPASGALLGPGGPGGWHQGTETVAVSASDASGIKRTGITIDTSRHWADQVCDYTRPRPCPPSVVATHSVNLNVVADGRHQLRVGAADAAGQERHSDPVELKIDSHAPSSPKGLRVARNRDGSWRISWTNPPQGAAAPIVAARYVVCRRASSADCPVESRSSAVGIDELDVRPPRAGGAWGALVWLEDEAANHDRGSGARVSLKVPATARRSGAAPRRRARLRITRVSRSGRRLRVTGTIGRTATGRVAVRVRARRGGPLLVRGQARVRRGRWRISARLPRALQGRRAALVTVRYRGDRRHAPQAITRRIGHR